VLLPAAVRNSPPNSLPHTVFAPVIHQRYGLVTRRQQDRVRLAQQSDIYVINPDGTGAVKLTNCVGDDDGPVWSPDGSPAPSTPLRSISRWKARSLSWVPMGAAESQTGLVRSKSGLVARWKPVGVSAGRRS